MDKCVALHKDQKHSQRIVYTMNCHICSHILTFVLLTKIIFNAYNHGPVFNATGNDWSLLSAKQ